MKLNDLPRLSSWPARLLNLEPCPLRQKTPKEIVREFENEKWGPLLKKVKQHRGRITIQQVDQWVNQQTTQPFACLMAGKLEALPLKEFHQRYLDLIEKTLKVFLPASALVELGCGYGSVLLNMAQRRAFCKTRLMAADYVPAAREVTRHIAGKQGQDIQVGHCDLGSSAVTDLPIPSGAVIFTSYAVMYVPQLRDKFISGLLKFKPRAIVHFEPCYEYFDPKSLLSLMKRRYMHVNDYNRNLVSLLYRHQGFKRIRILKEQPDIIGNNALCPASLLIWKPKII